MSITFDPTNTSQATDAIADILAAGRTPQDIAAMVQTALDDARAATETAKTWVMFSHMGGTDFTAHLALMLDRGGRMNAETVVQDFVTGVLANDQDAYMYAAFQAVKTLRLNLPHVEMWIYTTLKAAHDASPPTLPSALEPALATVTTYLQSVGLLP